MEVSAIQTRTSSGGEEPGECAPQCLCLNCRCHLAHIALVFFWTGDFLYWFRGVVSVNQHAAVLKELHVLSW